MAALLQELRLILMAVQFLTRLPVPGWVGFEPLLMKRAVRHFPLVGAGVGAAGAAVAIGAQTLWPNAVAATLAVAATVWLTVAFHEDGLADTFDALLGAAPREKALAIMKDSRIGSYGAAALGSGLLLRVLMLAELLAHGALPAAAACVAAHAGGRAAAVALMRSLPYARDDTDPAAVKAGALARDVRLSDAIWAATSGALLLGLTAWLQRFPVIAFGSAFLALALLVLLLRAWLRRRLGGYTGDTLGAAEQLGQIAVLLAFAASWPR